MSAQATSDAGLSVRFDVENRVSHLEILPQVTSTTDRELRYELRSQRQGHSGRSSTSQSGTFRTGASDWHPVSRLSLSCLPDDHCEISLRLWDKDKLVAEERFSPVGTPPTGSAAN